jgi:hypothetical protein
MRSRSPSQKLLQIPFNSTIGADIEDPFAVAFTGKAESLYNKLAAIGDWIANKVSN